MNRQGSWNEKRVEHRIWLPITEGSQLKLLLQIKPSKGQAGGKIEMGMGPKSPKKRDGVSKGPVQRVHTRGGISPGIVMLKEQRGGGK